MSTITHGLLATVLAATKENAFACIGSVFNWGHARVFMAAIARWLFAAFATGAPEVLFSFFNLDSIRGFLRYNRSCHFLFLRARSIISSVDSPCVVACNT